MKGALLLLLLITCCCCCCYATDVTAPVPAVVRARAYLALGMTDRPPFNQRETVLVFSCDYPDDEIDALAQVFPAARIQKASEHISAKNAEHAKRVIAKQERERKEAEEDAMAEALVDKYISHCPDLMNTTRGCTYYQCGDKEDDRMLYCRGTKEIDTSDNAKLCDIVWHAIRQCGFCSPACSWWTKHEAEDIDEKLSYTCENSPGVYTVVVIPKK